tara:strand:+ start:206 stop:439 length:234 start_codon:yes stop_codon:yes gene_type:complete
LHPIDLSFDASKFHPIRRLQTGIFPYFIVDVIEPLLVVSRDDAMTNNNPHWKERFQPTIHFSKGSLFHEEKNALGIS